MLVISDDGVSIEPRKNVLGAIDRLTATPRTCVTVSWSTKLIVRALKLAELTTIVPRERGPIVDIASLCIHVPGTTTTGVARELAPSGDPALKRALSISS